MSFRALLSLPAALFFASSAHAGIPDPRYCVVDTCLVVAPAGNFAYPVIVKDESLAPVADVIVVLDFGTAPGMALCSSSDPDGDRRVIAMTDASGLATFLVRGGGQSTGYVVVSANGQTILIAYPRSTDLNGDLAITTADVTLHDALPPNSRAGNYDCDADADAADRTLISSELGQDCNTVPVLGLTWGAVKATYR